MRLLASEVLGHHATGNGHCLMLRADLADQLGPDTEFEVEWSPSFASRYLSVAVERSHRPVHSVLVEVV